MGLSVNSRALATCTTLLMLAIATPVSAQGTQAEQSACTPDVLRLCGAYIPDAERITVCLRSQPQKLNAACREAVGQGAGGRTGRVRS